MQNIDTEVITLPNQFDFLEKDGININETDNLLNLEETPIRRACDFIIALSLFGLLIPVFLVVAAFIKITSKGPVFFIQERLGKDRVPFDLYKFRTMVPNAEKETGPVWAKKDDPRVTSAGNFLRKSRLDELPQLINVIKGDMALVGCRPIREHFADILSDEIDLYELRFQIKPGLTGLAQIKESYANSVEAQKEKFYHELYYLVNRNFLLDVKILLKTLLIPFKKMGA